MAILTTGAGLIGCQTATILAARGEIVVLLDLCPNRTATASFSGIENVLAEAGDVCNRVAMMTLFQHQSVDPRLPIAAELSTAIH
jgi:UDP-glucose 4-epimerase